MHIRNLHGWDLSVSAARAVQDELVGLVDPTTPLRLSRGDLVLGVDNSYLQTATETTAFAAAIVMTWPDFEIVEVQRATRQVTFPYIPGLLTFRELPVLVEALRKVEHDPALIFSDGHGIAHPRGIGIAAHLGLLAATPTIGIAKKPFRNTWEPPGPESGAHTPLYRQDGTHVGYAIRTSARRKHPVFASPGHLIRVEDVVEPVVIASGGAYLPKPQQAAHDEVSHLRKALKEQKDT
ncbi:MAG TPA: endonuclease V [Thermomicrobiales bacterium]|nr:endonuclease V [Thermomicrobiales bacterium]